MNDLTKGNIRKTFILFAVPMVLSGLLSQGYNIIDTIIAGKFLGDGGLAAIGATSALISVISSVFWGYGNGFSIYVANLFGAKKYQKMKNAIYTNYSIVSIIVIVLSIIMIACHNFIFDLLKVDEAIRDGAFTYFSIYIGGLVFINLSCNGIYIMNALGVSSYPFYMALFSAVINIIGNIFTVTVLHMGVAGIAISTVFAAFFVTVCYIIRIGKYFKELDCENDKLQFEPKNLKETLIYSMPTTAQQMIMYLASVIVSPLINGISGSATAAYTVIMKLYDINASIYQNSAKTLSSYSAQCIGAKKYNKIYKGVSIALIQGILFLLPPLLICVIFSNQICALFFPKGYSGEAFELSSTFIRFYLPFIMFNMINNLFHALCRGVKAMNLLMISTLIGAAARIISSIILYKPYGMHGIYIGWVFSWIAETIFVFIIYFKGSWKPKELKEEEIKNEIHC